MYPSQSEVRKQLGYVRTTGEFWWRAQPSNRVKTGGRAGTIDRGKIRIKIKIGNVKSLQYAHVLAWIMEFGPIPHGAKIVHKNGNGMDNRIANLEMEF